MFSILFYTYALSTELGNSTMRIFFPPSPTLSAVLECIVSIKNAIQIFIVWCEHGSFCFTGYLQGRCNLMYR